MTWQDAQPKPQSQEDQIRANMDSKQLAIRISGASRDAVLITTSKMKHKEMTDEEIEAELLKWKKFIYKFNEPAPF